MKIWKIIVGILGAIGALFATVKSKELKQLKGVIIENKKKERLVEKEIKILEESKQSSKREIGRLKRKLTNTKKNTQRMEKVFTEDNADEAVDFLRKFANK